MNPLAELISSIGSSIKELTDFSCSPIKNIAKGIFMVDNRISKSKVFAAVAAMTVIGLPVTILIIALRAMSFQRPEDVKVQHDDGNRDITQNFTFNDGTVLELKYDGLNERFEAEYNGEIPGYEFPEHYSAWVRESDLKGWLTDLFKAKYPGFSSNPRFVVRQDDKTISLAYKQVDYRDTYNFIGTCKTEDQVISTNLNKLLNNKLLNDV